MNNLFIGMMLVYLSISFTFGNSKIDLLPDFIGFFIIVKGLVELSDKSDKFTKIKPFVQGLSIYTLITFCLNLFGLVNVLGGFAVILGIVYMILLIYTTYTIVLGIKDIENNLNTSLNSEKLMSNWKLMTIFNVLTFVTIFIPAISVICLIINIVFIILFLISFNTTKNLYYENNKY